MFFSLEKREIYLSEDLAITMIKVPGGSFLMGSEEENTFGDEKPIHEVRLGPYWIADTPVTQAQWEAVMGNNPSFFRGTNRPVEQVSWDDAQDFIRKLLEQTQESFCLPTEAQWEFGARGGGNRLFKYSGSNKLVEIGWNKENSHYESKPVKLKFPNELGLYDMSGNVWEWCEDWYSESYYKESKLKEPLNDPRGPEMGDSRVIRGGSWINDPSFCRVSNRLWYNPEACLNNLGFRLSFPD